MSGLFGVVCDRCPCECPCVGFPPPEFITSVFGTHRSGVGNWDDPGCVPGGLLSPGLKSSFSDSITGQSKSFQIIYTLKINFDSFFELLIDQINRKKCNVFKSLLHVLLFREFVAVTCFAESCSEIKNFNCKSYIWALS